MVKGKLAPAALLSHRIILSNKTTLPITCIKIKTDKQKSYIIINIKNYITYYFINAVLCVLGAEQFVFALGVPAVVGEASLLSRLPEQDISFRRQEL